MRKFPTHVSHHECEVAELRADRELALEYLKVAVEALGQPGQLAGGLLGVAIVAEAYCDLAVLATEAGVSDDPLYGVIPPSGVPSFDSASEYERWFHQQMEGAHGPPLVSEKLA